MKKIVNKYFIYFEGLEILGSNEIRISKKEFDTQFSCLYSQYHTYKDCDGEYQISYYKKRYDYESHYLISHRFNIGTLDIYLKEIHCKSGYYFV